MEQSNIGSVGGKVWLAVVLLGVVMIGIALMDMSGRNSLKASTEATLAQMRADSAQRDNVIAQLQSQTLQHNTSELFPWTTLVVIGGIAIGVLAVRKVVREHKAEKPS